MRPISKSGKDMSRSISGSTMLTKTTQATPAAKKEGHKIAPRRWARGRRGICGSFLGMIVLVEAEYISRHQSGARFAQKLQLSGHLAVASAANGGANGVQVTAISINARGQVGCAKMNVAGAVRSVTGHAVHVKNLFPGGGHGSVGPAAGQMLNVGGRARDFLVAEHVANQDQQHLASSLEDFQYTIRISYPSS